MSFGSRRFLVCLLLAPLACAADVRPVTIGLVAPPAEADATSLLRGVQLAVDEANETGGAHVGLEVRGENGQWGTVGNDAVVLVCERHVDGIVAPSDGASAHLILQVAGRTRVPVATVCPDSSVTDAGVPWAVCVVPRTDLAVAALFAATQPADGPRLQWWAIVPTGRAGRPVRRDLETAARSTGTALDRIIDADERRMDIDSLVQSIVAGTPDGVLLWLPPAQAGSVVAALRAADYRGHLAGPGPLDSTAFTDAAGTAATGVLVVAFQTDTDARGRSEAFAQRYRQRFDAEPDSSAKAAHDAARVLIETLRRTAAGEGYREFPLAAATTGVTGLIHFDNAGNRSTALQVLTFHEGRFVPFQQNKTQP